MRNLIEYERKIKEKCRKEEYQLLDWTGQEQLKYT